MISFLESQNVALIFSTFLGPLFLQNGFSNADFHYVRGFCRDFVAKGVRQKEFGKKATKKVTEASEKVTESVPKTEKSDRTPFAALLLRHPDCRDFVMNFAVDFSVDLKISVLRLQGLKAPRNPQKKFTQKSTTKSTLSE